MKTRTTRLRPICSMRSGANDRAIPPLFFEERGARSVSVFTLENEWLGLRASTDGAAIWRFFAKAGSDEVPLMRAPEDSVVRHAGQSACFPLVPFGNRVRDNRFMFEGAAHALAPNTDWDKHYLHGDGWISEWRLAERTGARARLVMRHVGAGTPYTYDAAQTFTLDRSTLVLGLEVVNRGARALPFGLGWHPYFPLTAGTTLRAPASALWLEGADWLPTRLAPAPVDLDFAFARELPRRWVNNGFEGWNGDCEIAWPDRRVRLKLNADRLFGRYFLVVSDPKFSAGYNFEFFAFEPMSHSANAHNLPDCGGLRRLAPGQSLSGRIRFTVELGPSQRQRISG
jgi:aldose 1-epimerase